MWLSTVFNRKKGHSIFSTVQEKTYSRESEIAKLEKLLALVCEPAEEEALCPVADVVEGAEAEV